MDGLEPRNVSDAAASLEKSDVGQMSQEEFDRNVFPQLFQIVDHASVKSQKRHLTFFRWNLVLLVLAATPAFIQAVCGYFIRDNQSELLDTAARLTALLAALLFAGTLFASFLIRLRQYDREWYQGRAIAESIKSIVWKFMMGAEPYSFDGGNGEAEKKYLADLNELLKTAPKLSAHVGHDDVHAPQLTNGMKRLRAAELSQRQQAYSKFRIDDERKWYARKASQHASSEQFMFNAVVICQITALFLAMIRIAWPKTPFHVGPILASLAAALLAWSQLRRFGEQAIAYSMATRDLGFISEQAKFVNNDADLARYVADAENAISREHTMWLARREVSPVNRRAQPQS